ncbi:MAG: NAD(P)-dependent alcohol dehydrogenase [Gammaproteobacteria bacterium]
MTAIVYSCYGAAEVLRLENVEKPVATGDRVLVRVHAAAVNPLDWHYMRGTPYLMRFVSGFGKPDDPRLGTDFSGTVEAVGAGVERFKPGDEVFGAGSGAFADYLVIREDRALALKPSNLTFEQAASLPVAAITALQALRDKGEIESGQKVLINGASGGVGSFAVQIAKSLGAEVTGVCSTRNVELVRALGADHVIDYTREDFTTVGRRYDLVIDNVGNHSLFKYRDVLEPDGIFVVVGGPDGRWIGPLVNSLVALLLSPFVDQSFRDLLAVLSQDDLMVLRTLAESGKLAPVIDRHYRLSGVADAIRYSETGRARGKIIVNID